MNAVARLRRKLGPGERAGPLHLAWESELSVDFLCYTPQEFDDHRKRVTIVRQALTEGLEVPA